jgi:hypothetical protein
MSGHRAPAGAGDAMTIPVARSAAQRSAAQRSPKPARRRGPRGGAARRSSTRHQSLACMLACREVRHYPAAPAPRPAAAPPRPLHLAFDSHFSRMRSPRARGPQTLRKLSPIVAARLTICPARGSARLGYARAAIGPGSALSRRSSAGRLLRGSAWRCARRCGRRGTPTMRVRSLGWTARRSRWAGRAARVGVWL